jgi:CheY-like chemotaxis protein
MPDGGTVTLSTSNLDVTEPGEPAGDWVTLSVRDEGVGMDRDTRARIFEPFFTTKEGSAGTGLGLATVRGILEQAGGLVEVDSSPGCGALFTVFLPRIARPAAKPSAPAATPAAHPHPGRRNVLVVDDDEDVRLLLAERLRRLGYRVADAPDAERAIAEAAHMRVDLLVTDVVLPGMSGPRLVDALRESQPDLRVILISGYADGLVEEAGLRRAAFLQKPFTVQALGRTIAEMLA